MQRVGCSLHCLVAGRSSLQLKATAEGHVRAWLFAFQAAAVNCCVHLVRLGWEQWLTRRRRPTCLLQGAG